MEAACRLLHGNRGFSENTASLDLAIIIVIIIIIIIIIFFFLKLILLFLIYTQNLF